MKTLNDYIRESILDDEEELINKAIEDSYWATIYKLLKSKKETEAAKILNNKFKPCKYGGWRKDTDVYRSEHMVTFYSGGIGSGPIRISSVTGKKQLRFVFQEFFSKSNSIKIDFYKYYGIKYDDFRNNFRVNLIKQLDLKKDDSLGDEWIMEL